MTEPVSSQKGLQRKSHVGLVLLAMMLGLFMTSLDSTVISASITTVVRDLSGFSAMSWVFTAYMLASTSTTLVFGKLSDQFGRKRFFLVGIALFLIGSTLCGSAHSMIQLIVYRAIQGIGSGAIFPISFTVIYSLFTDAKQAAKMSGLFAAVFGLSSVLGPQIGTWLTDSLSWRWCFYVNVPFGVISFVVLLFGLHESKADRKTRIDWAGTSLLIMASVTLMLALTWGGQKFAWSAWEILSLFAIAALAAGLFCFVEYRAAEPILPLALLRNRAVAATGIVCFCQGAVQFSSITYLPIFAVRVLGYSNSNSILTPMMLSLMAGATLFGFLCTVLPMRVLMTASMAMSVVTTGLLATVGFTVPAWYMVVLMVLLGLFAVGPMMSLGQNAIAASVDAKYIGITSSFVGFWRSIGGVFGASLTATVVNSVLKQQLPTRHTILRDSLGTAIHHGYTVSIVLSVLGVIAALCVGPVRYQRRQAAATEARAAS